MNILLTLRQPLLPADTGGKVRSFNILSRLAKRISIHAVSFADPVRDATAISEMKRIFKSYTPVPWRETAKYSAGFYAEVCANQLGAWPYFLAKCNRPEFTVTVRALAKRRRFDLLFCDFLHTAAPQAQYTFKPKIVFEHNVEYLLRKRKWAVETNPVRKWILKNEWIKTRSIEEMVCRNCERVLVVSNDDKETMRSDFGISHVDVLPTGVDTDYFSPSHDGSRPGRLAFVGSMDWEPNEDGVSWFLSEVYPRIRAMAPNASLAVVGRNPSSRLRTLASRQPDVEVTGRVSDVRPYIAEAEVVIVPLRVGGGTRIKIPEAMAMSKAVVSTAIGAEGLPFRSGREICIADEPGDFADAVTALLHNRSQRTSIAAAARKIVVEKYGWDAAVDKAEETIHELADPMTSIHSIPKLSAAGLYA